MRLHTSEEPIAWADVSDIANEVADMIQNESRDWQEGHNATVSDLDAEVFKLSELLTDALQRIDELEWQVKGLTPFEQD